MSPLENCRWLRSVRCYEPLVAVGVGNRPLTLIKLGSDEKEHVCVCDCVCASVQAAGAVEPSGTSCWTWGLLPDGQAWCSSLLTEAYCPSFPAPEVCLKLTFCLGPGHLSPALEALQGYLLLTSSCLQMAHRNWGQLWEPNQALPDFVLTLWGNLLSES